MDDFAATLPEQGRLLSLDVGTATIGTALCDAGWRVATPAALIRRQKWSDDRAVLRALIAREAIVGIVIGLPLNMDGSDSPRTQSVRAFAQNVSGFGLPILLWDERWSTMAVERALIAADVSRAKRAARIDNAAAAWILEGALAALRREEGNG